MGKVLAILSALAQLLSLLVDRIRAHDREQAHRDHQDSHDAIEHDPAGSFVSRYGMRDTLPGDCATTPEANAGERRGD